MWVVRVFGTESFGIACEEGAELLMKMAFEVIDGLVFETLERKSEVCCLREKLGNGRLEFLDH